MKLRMIKFNMFKKISLSLFLIVTIFFLAFFLRLWNLGYSDYQGDEIKALFIPEENENSWTYLLDQRKGPNQFLVTWAVRAISDNYQNYFIVRFPFALAGFLSVVVFFLVVRKIFNEKIAIISTIFFATNGFLVALSRIVQYQSFVIFLGLLSIYFYLLFRERAKLPYLYGSFALLALSILFHYDGFFFGVYIGILILTDLVLKFWGEKKKQGRLANLEVPSKFASLSVKKLIKHLSLSGLVFLLLIFSFYIPFILNLSEQTLNYWSGRITGNVSTKISSSYYLFQVYQPIYAVHFYTLFTILGLILGSYPILIYLIKSKFKIQIPKFMSDPINWRFLGVLIWFLVAFLFMEALVSVPGTHIYTYLIPLMAIMGFGLGTALEKLDNFFKKRVLLALKYVYSSGIIIAGIFLFLQSWTIFVDHTREYPWQEENFLVFYLFKPTPIFHLSMFGFPYQRGWQEIGEFVNDQNTYYTSNERVSITRYYVNIPKESKKIGYYIYIKNPQSFTNDIPKGRIQEWVLNNPPVKEIKNMGGNNTLIYFIPEIEEANFDKESVPQSQEVN